MSTCIIAAIFFGIITVIFILIGVYLLIKENNLKQAIGHAQNNRAHCEHDKTNSPNCAGPTCSKDIEKCRPPYETLSSPAAIDQIVTALSPSAQSWDDVNKIVRYAANLVSSLERNPQIPVLGWKQKTFNSEKYGPSDFPLGKIFYNNDTATNDTIFIALRGTASNSKEWSQDLKINQIQLPPDSELGVTGKVHQGFLEILNDILPRIKEIMGLINFTTTPIPSIVVTGHSLGASLSVLIALYLRQNYQTYKILCIPFACPRIGNPDFVKSVDTKLSNKFQIYRITNTNDIIPNTPLSVTPNLDGDHQPWIYQHVGKEFYYTDNWGSWDWNHFLNNYIQAMYSPAKYKLYL